MAEAEVADDVLGKDPTADRLERRVAELLGREAALFFPSGTQANQAALILHGRPGTEAVCEREAHVFHYELAGAARLAGVQLHTIPSDAGRIRAEDYEAAIRPGDPHHPLTSVLWMENTHNMHGGVIVAPEAMRAVRTVAESHHLPVHLDGARLWNASAASGVALAEYAACADTVMLSLSKGLGCPVGSVLVGDGDLMERAWGVRKALGGGMRQVGILAAAGLYALDHHLQRLDEDRVRARRLAEGADAADGLRADPPGTNIVMIHIEREGVEPEALSRRLADRGVWILPAGPRRLRAVTHLDVDDAGIERAVEALEAAIGG